MVRPIAKVKVSSASERSKIIDDDIVNISNIPLPDEAPVKPADEQKPVTSSSSFKPFASDPEKQERYEKFLMFKNLGLKGCIFIFQLIRILCSSM